MTRACPCHPGAGCIVAALAPLVRLKIAGQIDLGAYQVAVAAVSYADRTTRACTGNDQVELAA